MKAFSWGFVSSQQDAERASLDEQGCEAAACGVRSLQWRLVLCESMRSCDNEYYHDQRLCRSIPLEFVTFADTLTRHATPMLIMIVEFEANVIPGHGDHHAAVPEHWHRRVYTDSEPNS